MKYRIFSDLPALAATFFLLVGVAPVLAADYEPGPGIYNKEGIEKLTGKFTGKFGNSKITVCLEKIVGQTVLGYSVVSGNERAFSGSYKDVDGTLEFTTREPGDDDADGEFKFKMLIDEGRIVGKWTQFKKKRGVEFDLAKREFKYDPEVGEFPQASTRLLKESDVENIRPKDLRIMRNEIYARHGYSFKLADMRKHFDTKDWYMPMASDVSSQLTEIEEKNAALIKNYEDYGNEYYDSIGR